MCVVYEALAALFGSLDRGSYSLNVSLDFYSLPLLHGNSLITVKVLVGSWESQHHSTLDHLPPFLASVMDHVPSNCKLKSTFLRCFLPLFGHTNKKSYGYNELMTFSILNILFLIPPQGSGSKLFKYYSTCRWPLLQFVICPSTGKADKKRRA